VIERKHHDTNHRVKVLDDGFEYRGARFGDREGDHRTGLDWFAFFGLTDANKPTVKSSGARPAEA